MRPDLRPPKPKAEREDGFMRKSPRSICGRNRGGPGLSVQSTIAWGSLFSLILGLALLAGWALPSYGQSLPEAVELATTKAALALQEGRPQEALFLLEPALRQAPRDPQVRFLLAAALTRVGRPKEALQYLQELEREDPLSPGLEAELALARQRLESTETQKQARAPYRVQLRAGFEYDSNVPTLAEDLGLRTRKDKEDVRFVFQGYGDYKLLRGDPWELGAAVSLYSSSHFDLHEYDYHGPTGALYGGYRWGAVYGRVKYQYSYFWLDTDSYLRQHAAGPELWWEQAAWAKLNLAYVYSNNAYFDPKDLDRDSFNHKVGFLQILQLNKDAALRFYYYFDRENAQGKDWDYSGHDFGVVGSLKLPWELKVQGGIGFYRRDFDNRHSIFGEYRNDDRWTFSVELARHIFGPLEAGLSYVYVRNQSSVSFYEYTRSIVGLQVRAAF